MLSLCSKSWVLHVLAAALILIFGFTLYSESSIKSPTSDEPPHIASGLSYVETGVFRGNPQHPPFLKELSGLSMSLGGIRWPHTEETGRFIRGEIPQADQPEWQIGNRLISANGPDRVLSWARLPFLLIACLLGFLIYRWGSQIAGGVAALGALFLYILDPTILGHGFLVTMDVGVAAFSVLFLFALWNYVQSPSLLRLALCGLALGAALGAKFSAVLLIPVAAVLLFAAVLWPEEPVEGRRRSALDLFHAWKNQQQPNATRVSGKPGAREAKRAGGKDGATDAGVLPESSSLARRLGLCACALLAMGAVAYVAVQAMYFFPRDLLTYYHGLQTVNADHQATFEAFLAGDFQNRFLSYFAAAYLLKEPIPGIVLALAGAVALVLSRNISRISKLFLLLPPVVVVVAHTFLADDIGIRYIMAALPFAHLMGGVGLAALISARAKWLRGVAIALCGWAVLAAAGTYPDHLSYFNESACLLQDPGRIGLDGGSQCGTAWLADSNVDWGQGLKQLKSWLDVNARGRTVKLANPFGFPAEAYGIASQPMTDEELVRRPPPGLYAVSAHVIATLAPGTTVDNWPQNTPPAAIVGHAFYIYDIR